MINNRFISGLIIVMVLSLNFSLSQTIDHKHHSHKSKYTSELNNEIKALSKEEVKQLLNGDGMGLAKAAELNGYPGPLHVLELSSELNLTEEQSKNTEALFHSVKSEAKKLGELIVQKEKELDILFKENKIDENLLRNKLSEISELKSNLRFAHLNTHLLQKDILTEEQIKSYKILRGYINQ